ncbi:MAG: tetratricopeptide repeat protein, partial [Firmicutes bacterium]|nr:tetratricopeptide repeat protein [Bacillota bacterium]
HGYWCLDVSEKLDHPYSRASYLMLMGFSQNRQNNLKEAIRYCILSYQILRGYSWQDSFIFNQVLSIMALDYYNIGEMQEAVIYYKKLAAIAESKDDKVSICDYYDMIGNCYFRLGEGNPTADKSSPGLQYIILAEESFRKALPVARAIKDEVRTARELNNIAYSLFYQTKNDDAVKTAGEGIQILERVGDKEKLANALFVYARILYAGKQTSLALDNFLRSAKLFEEINSPEDLKACYQWLAEIYSGENIERMQ